MGESEDLQAIGGLRNFHSRKARRVLAVVNYHTRTMKPCRECGENYLSFRHESIFAWWPVWRTAGIKKQPPIYRGGSVCRIGQRGGESVNTSSSVWCVR